MKDHPDQQNIDAWIAAELLNDLTQEERETLDHYFQENPEARSLHQKTTAMSHLLNESLAGARPGPNFENRLLRAFREQAAQHPMRNLFVSLSEKLRGSLRLPALYIPAALGLFVGLTALGSLLTKPTATNLARGTSLLAQDGKDRKLRQGDWGKSAAIPLAGANTYSGGTTISAGSLGMGSAVASSVMVAASDSSGSFALSGLQRERSKKEVVVNEEKDFKTKSHPVVQLQTAAVGRFSGRRTEGQESAVLNAKLGDLASASTTSAQAQVPVAQMPSDKGVIDRRKLVRDASLDLEVKNYDVALDAITAVATANSGYVSTKNSARLPNGKMSGTVVVKVLPARLDDALIQIRALGELKNQSLSTRDVTKEYFDTDARLKNARKMEERLLSLLETMKGKITELLAVEKELARVREQIEQMQGELKVYDSLVQYATITISLREKDLNEAAAYLLEENVTLSVFSTDVEKTYGVARQQAEEAKVQIVRSRIDRDDSGRATAVFSFLVAPEEADVLISRLKSLGRVQNFNREDRRVPQDGAASSSKAKVDRDKVQIDFSILQDDESKKQVALTIVTKQIESAFDHAKSAAAAQGGTIVSSNLQHPAGGGTSATITVRVPSGNYQNLLETFKKTGLVSQFNIQRDDTGMEDGGKPPVLILLTLTDTDQPIQFTQASILNHDVEALAIRLKQAAEKSGSQVEIKDSSYERTPDGRQAALLVFRLPLAKYQPFMNEIGGCGKMKEISVRRQDRTDAVSGSLATAEITLRLYSQGDVVAEGDGLWPTLRKTLGEGAASLMWSVRMIGVALAFIAPWVLLTGIISLIFRKYAKRREAALKKPRKLE